MAYLSNWDDEEPDDDDEEEYPGQKKNKTVEIPQDTGEADEEQPPNAAQPKPEDRFLDLYKAAQGVNNDGPMTSAYRNYLDEGEVDKSKYKPTKMNRLGAILGGMAEGYFHGPAAGMELTESQLDKPYRDAQVQDAMRGKRLQAGAALEEKDMGRRVALIKDALLEKHQADQLKQAGEHLNAQIDHWNAQDQNAATHAAAAGWHRVDNKVTGTSKLINVTNDDEVDLGRTDQSTEEKMKDALRKIRATQNAIGVREKDVEGVRQTGREKLEGIRQNDRIINENQRQGNRIELDKQRGQRESDIATQRANESGSNIYTTHISRMQAIADKNGPKAEQYFNRDPKSGRVMSLKPGDPNTDPDYKTIYDYVYGPIGKKKK